MIRKFFKKKIKLKGKFLTELKDKRVKKNGKIYIELLEDLIYHDSKDHVHVVPIGYISDGASIPSLAWSIVGHPFDLYLESAIVHDFLCEKKIVIFTQKAIDWVLLDAMKSQKISLWKRQIMHKSVRMFGWIYRYFNRKNKK